MYFVFGVLAHIKYAFSGAYPCFGGSKRLPGWFGALARLSAGGGQILFGQCPNAERVNPKGSSLTGTIRLKAYDKVATDTSISGSQQGMI